VVLGGDGTILGALRRYAGTGIPVFGVNFGQVGFLATVDPDGLQDDFARAFGGRFELLRLPSLRLEMGSKEAMAINDVSLHRRVGERVALLAYAVGGEEVGSVRCDGLVVATPAGSTGYNLANGGPVLAWGVEGYVVSFIAPHSLTARPLVAAPGDVMTIENRSAEDSADVTVDGRPTGELRPGESMTCRFVENTALLAQLPGSTFYRRLRDKFGRLAV
jgi:NAD+ kinase